MADPNRQPRRVAPDFAPPGSTGGLRPTASGSFNYVPPAKEAGFAEAIKSLSALEPQIEAIVGRHDARADEKAKSEGAQRALEAGGMTEEEAIKAGKLSVTDSKAFRVGYRTQFWRTQALTWASESREAWAKSDKINSDDPRAAHQFLAGFFQDKLKDIKDPYARDAALPVIQQTYSNLIAAQSEYRQKRQMADHVANFGREVGTMIDEVVAGRLSKEAFAAKLADVDKRALATGVEPGAFNEQLVTAIKAKALAAGSAAILDLAKLHPKLAGNPKTDIELRSVGMSIRSQAMAAESHRLALQNHAERKAEKDALVAAVTEAIKLGGQNLSPQRLQEIGRVNPSAAITAMSVAKAIRDEAKESDPAGAFHAWEVMRNSPDPIAALGALIHGRHVRGGDVARLHDLGLRLADKATAAGLTEVDDALKHFDGQFRPDGPMGKIAPRINPQQLAVAKMFIVEQVNEFLKKTPGASRFDVQALTNKLVEDQTKRLEATAKTMGGHPLDYNAARDAVTGAPPKPTASPAPPPSAPPGAAPGKVPAPPKPPAAAPAPNPANSSVPPPWPPDKPLPPAVDITKMSVEQLRAYAQEKPQNVQAVRDEIARRRKQ